jgi:hypothetical protein
MGANIKKTASLKAVFEVLGVFLFGEFQNTLIKINFIDIPNAS